MHSTLIRLTLIMSVASSPLWAAFDLTNPQPPVAAKKPKDVTVHEDKRIDDYFWLREKENPEVKTYLEQENAYTESVLAPAKELRAQLFSEMRGRIKEDDTSAKQPYLVWVYYTRMEKDKQYPIFCRAKDEAKATEEILIDLNKLGAGKPYIAVGSYRVSDDGQRLAYSLDWTGYRQYEVHVIDLATKAEIAHKIPLVSDLEWGAGHDVLYYVTENESKRSDKLHRWTLSTGKAELLIEDKDELFNIDINKSNDGKWLFSTAESKVTSDVLALRADQPTGQFKSLAGRVADRKYFAEHRDDRFYFATNQGAKNYKVVWAAETSADKWTDLIPHNPAIKVETIDAFASTLVIEERENGLPQVRFYDFATGESKRIALPDEVYEVSEETNWNYDAPEFRYRYQSLARPASVFATNFKTGERRLIKETEVLGGFKSENYTTERLWATARDGVKIPLSVVYRKGLDLSKPQPLWLYGYGSYGISMPISFSANRVSMLDRGVIYVIAHVRGGGELGEEWRDAGRMEKKMTTFNDFVDCGQWLVDRKWTSPEKLVTSGGSAGGLLMGAVVNQRPDLFKAAIAYVPFVDVLNTMLDATLPLTTEEYVEWGNPNIKAEYEWMRAYSPYDNVKPAKYPNMLYNVSFYDSQVPYWEGAKLLAKTRVFNQSKNPLLLHTNFGAGHGGASGRYDALNDVARDYAFFLSSLGLDKK
ncbi:S9 family peptidase [Oleiharenicola lentus]|uniref:S9 family peptidase n=1 Tax=Oleiharenicola lentus TaxID=2508720 RepID=UPI003F67AA3E